MFPSFRSPRGRRLVALVIGFVLAGTGTAFAVVNGLQNASFENGLTGWLAQTFRGGTPSDPNCPDPSNRAQVYDEICVLSGADTFMNEESNTEVTVEPLDGAKMVRLGGPFTSSGQGQSPDVVQQLEQSFVVPANEPVADINFNIYTWDYSGFDDATFQISLVGPQNEVITERHQGSFGSGTDLKTTGWQPIHADLSGYEGQTVRVRISAGGTQDDLYGFWVYLDGGQLALPPVGQIEPTAPNTPAGQPVGVSSYPSPDGMTFITVPKNSFNGAAAFPDGCVPLTLQLPINPGSGTIVPGSVSLHEVLGGNVGPANSATALAGNVFRFQLSCAKPSALLLQWQLTEDGETQSFSRIVGSVTLIDPQGVVYDKADFDAHKLANPSATDAQARAAAAITGAEARLQKCSSADASSCHNALSGDPGISPNVNPETTKADGLFQWDVAPGKWRVVVTKTGYTPKATPIYAIPPEVTDAHVALEKPAAPDTDDPETAITSAPAAGAKTGGSVTLKFTADELGATFACKLDSGAFLPCDSPRTLTGLGSGSHTYSVRATDVAGNEDETPATVTWTVDATAPDTAIVSGPTGNVTSKTATFAFKSGEAASFQCKLDGSAYGPCSSPRALSNLSVGPHTFSVRAKDTVGNVDATPAARSWTVSNPPKQNNPTIVPPGPCDGKTGSKLKVCNKQVKELAKCAGKKGKKKSTCVKRAKALAKCEAKKGKKKSKCIKKAKQIGKSKKSGKKS